MEAGLPDLCSSASFLRFRCFLLLHSRLGPEYACNCAFLARVPLVCTSCSLAICRCNSVTMPMRCFRRSLDHFCPQRATQPVVPSNENGIAVLDGQSHTFCPQRATQPVVPSNENGIAVLDGQSHTFCPQRATQPEVPSNGNGIAVLDGQSHTSDADVFDDGDPWIWVWSSDDESLSESEDLPDPAPVRPEPCEMARLAKAETEMCAKPKEENILFWAQLGFKEVN